jgi:hypothetical protein
MKHIIAAIAFAVLAVPTLAFAADTSAPFEKSQFDRTLPNLQNPTVAEQAPASAASTTTGSTNATGSGWATGAWANDHHFIAPE